ncbi:MAG: nuclear transport factor 2 family protein [Saprospiraceae bacterium]
MKQFQMLPLTLLLLLTALGSSSAQRSAETDKANIRAAYDALNHREWAAFSTLCAPNYTEVNVGPAPAVGINAAIELYQQFQTAFPDFMVKINDIAAVNPNRYLVQVTVTGTNTGSMLLLPPTGKSIKFDNVDVLEMDAKGKCISHAVSNPVEPLRQIGYESVANPSTQIVLAGYGKFGQGDIPGFLAMCSDDVMFDVEDHLFDSKARMFKGKAEVGQFFQEVNSKFQYTKFQPTRFVADGDDVFMLIDAEYTYVPTGKKYSSTYTHHFKVVNGKITYFRGVDDFQKMW